MRKFGILRAGIPVAVILILLCLRAAAHASSMEAVWPTANGVSVQHDDKLEVDSSNMDQGYVMVRVAEPGKKGFKLRISFGKGQLMYDINSSGDYEAYPLQLGSGKYEIALFENVKGSKYATAGTVKLDVRLRDENASYLVPNQYVSYELWTSAVQKSDELCAGASQADCYRIIADFMAKEFSYDFVRAKTISSGALPDIDYCYDNRMGICQDLAAVTACMLRVQGVPCKLVIGYADKYYHAWTNVVVNGKEELFDPTAAVGALTSRKYKTERMY